MDVPDHHPARHPFGHFEPARLHSVWVIVCCFVLFIAGILCAAGGIGGGGIYVTVLMVAGNVSVVDAVPLSKSIVFLGSVPSLILNLRKAMSSSGKTLIDYDICRLVIPGSLLGTFLGVVLNRVLPSWMLLLVLTGMLLFMTSMVTRTTIEQYMEETDAIKKEEELRMKLSPREAALVGVEEEVVEDTAGTPARAQRRQTIAGSSPRSPVSTDSLQVPVGKTQNILTIKDIVVSLIILTLVVFSGVFRYHAGICSRAHTAFRKEEDCHHPALFFVGYHKMQEWVEQGAAEWLMTASLVFPCIVCLIAILLWSANLVRYEGWRVCTVLSYDLMAVATGSLAGLVGIGGGLIYSPFFLLMAIDPAIAVATSSTCVIFTSVSTSLQYLLTDRVIISLALVYGLVNIVASYAGTSFVHFLMDDFHTRRSYISAIVGLGVLISAVLSVVKLGTSAAGVSDEVMH